MKNKFSLKLVLFGNQREITGEKREKKKKGRGKEKENLRSEF